MIDSHTHYFNFTNSKNSYDWAKENNEFYWFDLMHPKNKKSLQGWPLNQEIICNMKAANVDKIIFLGWYWQNKKSCLIHNKSIAESMRDNPDKFLGFASVLPDRNVIDHLNEAKDMGFLGVGELHPTLQNFEKNKKHWFDLANWCSDNKWPINMHVTESINFYNKDFIPTNFNDFIEIIREAPDVKMILSHWGGGIPFYEQNHIIKPLLKNIYYDTAASPLLYKKEIFENMVKLIGSEKIIFGSDYPLNLFPKKESETNMKTFIKSTLNNKNLSELDLKNIFSRNIKNLIRIK